MIRRTRFVIAVPDLEASAAYYRDVLGFAIAEIGDPGWRFFTLGQCTIMAGECPGALPPHELGDHGYFAYLEVEDVDAYHEIVRARGARIRKTLRDEPWGMREFGVQTADGHRMMIAAPIPE
jgi:catechol 2,3-dioxygenase-like lactoylglutathione lyase family enzyme